MDKLINYSQGQSIIDLTRAINDALHSNFSEYVNCTNSTVIPSTVAKDKVFLDARGQVQYGNMHYTNMEDCVLNEHEKIVLSNEYLTASFNVTGNIGGESDVFHITPSMEGQFLSMFNSPVIITNNVTSCAYMFQNAWNFNQPVTIPNSVDNCYRMFYNCRAYNANVIIPNSVNKCGYMFDGCNNFASTITLQDGITSIDYIMANAKGYNFNAHLIIPSSVQSMNGAFLNSEYNRPITLPNGVQYVENLCANMNGRYDITIPDNVVSMNYAFANYNAYYGNVKNITVGNNIRYMNNAFYRCNCNSLTIGDNAYSISYAANDARIYSSLHIGANISYAQNAFINCLIGNDIVINGVNQANYMFRNLSLRNNIGLYIYNINYGQEMFSLYSNNYIHTLNMVNCNNMVNAFYKQYHGFNNCNMYLDNIGNAYFMFATYQSFENCHINLNYVKGMSNMFVDSYFRDSEVYIGPNSTSPANMFRYATCSNTIIRMPSGMSTYGWSSDANNSVVRY